MTNAVMEATAYPLPPYSQIQFATFSCNPTTPCPQRTPVRQVLIVEEQTLFQGLLDISAKQACWRTSASFCYMRGDSTAGSESIAGVSHRLTLFYKTLHGDEVVWYTG